MHLDCVFSTKHLRNVFKCFTRDWNGVAPIKRYDGVFTVQDKRNHDETRVQNIVYNKL